MLSGYSYTGQGYDAALAGLETALAEAPPVTVPTTIIRGAQDPLETPAEFADDEARFMSIAASVEMGYSGIRRPEVG